MTKLSIIIPCYNVERYLKQCLDSIINQTLEDIEIILIDDGGKDNCPQIIDEYADRDSRIIAIHKENGDYEHSINIGLERTTGEYIGIVEPDDYIDSNMYEDLYNITDFIRRTKIHRRYILSIKWNNKRIKSTKVFNKELLNRRANA